MRPSVVHALVIRFNAELYPGIDTKLGADMLAGVAQAAHWAGLAVRAGVAFPTEAERSAVVGLLRMQSGVQ